MTTVPSPPLCSYFRQWFTQTQLELWATRLLFLFSLLYYALFFNYGLEVDDEGFLLWNAREILSGRWPYADFFSYAPLTYFVLAGFFQLLGDSVITERIFLLVLLLINGQMILWIARKILPIHWALFAVALYAVAPGPWYKLFFLTCILLACVFCILLIQKPSQKRVFLVGLTVGITAICRIEAGVITAILSAGTLFALWLDGFRQRSASINRFIFLAAPIALVGASLPIGGTLGLYWLAGKAESALYNIKHYVFSEGTGDLLEKMGILTLYDPLHMFFPFQMDQFFFSLGLIACITLVLYASVKVFYATPSENKSRGFWLVVLVIAMAALGSTAYSYLFVWGTRLLSTFALVYISYLFLLKTASNHLSSQRQRITLIIIGLVALSLPVAYNTKHQNYSGSITTRHAKTVSINTPLLHSVFPYAANQKDIERLLEEISQAPPEATLVSMSESTTMGYLSGLKNPTFYKAFGMEFARSGEQERAIAQFEKLKITFFVGRRSQFLNSGGPASQLRVYAPKIFEYLIDKYTIIPLGDHFILFKRKDSTG